MIEGQGVDFDVSQILFNIITKGANETLNIKNYTFYISKIFEKIKFKVVILKKLLYNSHPQFLKRKDVEYERS